MKMKVSGSGKAWRGSAVALAVVATAVAAQQMVERFSAQVNRTSPAVVDLGDAVLQRLRVPDGFEASIFARGLKAPRMMEVGRDGTVYVTSRDAGEVTALRDADGDGRAEQVRIFASGVPGVHGIDIDGGTMYLASSTTIWSTPLDAFAPRVLVDGLPDGGQHPNRMVRIGPDGFMYVSIGSSCNDCAEENQLERATLVRYSLDGRQREFVANGLRNTIGYDWSLVTGELWGMDHGSDWRGDAVPPEELNRIAAGNHYGWPICYAEAEVDPATQARPEQVALKPGQAMPSRQPLTREQFCAQTLPSVLTTTPHSAPMAMRFYDGHQFPPKYRDDAFVAMRGSWNRANTRGYNVMRVVFTPDGQPRTIEHFMTGLRGGDSEVYGRPVGIAIAADGSLLVSDDTVGNVYRIAWRGAVTPGTAR